MAYKSVIFVCTKIFSVSLKADYSLVSVSIYSFFSTTRNVQSPCLYWLLWLQVHISSPDCLPNFQFNVHSSSSRKTRQELLSVAWVTPKPQLIPSQPAFSPHLLVQRISLALSVPQILGTSNPTIIPSKSFRFFTLLFFRTIITSPSNLGFSLYTTMADGLSQNIALNKSHLCSENPGSAHWL